MQHNKSFLIPLFFIVFFLGSCHTIKQSENTKKPQPEWVKKHPTTNDYYVGIGSSNTSNLPPDAYRKNARDKALNALASEISVKISSSSVIQTIETDYKLSETYSRQIKSSSDKNLEGYEMVDEWNDGSTYWVYYRLSKAEYRLQKAKRKQAAIQQAKTKYLQAASLKNEGKQYNALGAYIDAFSDLSQYLAEPTDTDIENTKVDLGSSIYRELILSLNDINFSAKENPATIIAGVSINPELLEIQLTNKNGKAIANMPIKATSTTGGLSDNALKSDQNGIIHIPLDKVRSTRQTESINLEIDMVRLSRLTKDIFIRTLIKRIPTPSYKLTMNILSPKIYLESTEKSLGQVNNNDALKNAMYEAMASNNIRLANTVNEADFIVKIDSDTKKEEASSYQKSVSVQYNISIFDTYNRLIYRKNENHILGYGSNLAEAEKEAYSEAQNRLKHKNAPNIFNEILK